MVVTARFWSNLATVGGVVFLLPLVGVVLAFWFFFFVSCSRVVLIAPEPLLTARWQVD